MWSKMAYHPPPLVSALQDLKYSWEDQIYRHGKLSNCPRQWYKSYHKEIHDWISNDASWHWTSYIYCCIQKRSSQEVLQEFRAEREREECGLKFTENFMKEAGTEDGPSEWMGFAKIERKAKCVYGLNLGSQLYFCLIYSWYYSVYCGSLLTA